MIASSGILAAYDVVEKSQSWKTNSFVGIPIKPKTFGFIAFRLSSAWLLILPGSTKSGITPVARSNARFLR